MARANGRRTSARSKRRWSCTASGSAGTRSRLEQRFRRLVRGAGLPAPRSNVDDQRLRGRPLLARALRRDRRPPHARARTQVDDRIRDAALRAAGYTVLRFSEDDLNDRPALVLAELAAQQLAAGVAR